MADATPEKLRIVAFKDGEAWAAQCLEYDIAAQAADFDTLVRNMNCAILIEAQHTLDTRGERFKGIDPAPSHFEAMFESVSAQVCPASEPPLVSETDFRIAA